LLEEVRVDLFAIPACADEPAQIFRLVGDESDLLAHVIAVLILEVIVREDRRAVEILHVRVVVFAVAGDRRQREGIEIDVHFGGCAEDLALVFVVVAQVAVHVFVVRIGVERAVNRAGLLTVFVFENQVA
jgi:hypothetical protein